MALWAALTHFSLPSKRGLVCHTLLRTALRCDSTVYLYFLGKQREMENLSCRILNVDRKNLQLRCLAGFPSGSLVREQCSIYFKLPGAALFWIPGLRRSDAHKGFLCRTRIMKSHLLGESVSALQLQLPEQWIQRELRRHERHFLGPACLAQAALWLPAPDSADAVTTLSRADITCSIGPGRLRVVNLSPAGAKVQIDAADLTDRLANMDVRQLVLALDLHRAEQQELRIVLLCRCVESLYNIALRRLVLRLRFIRWQSADQAGETWQTVADSGIAELKDWFEQDYPVLTAEASDNPQQPCLTGIGEKI